MSCSTNQLCLSLNPSCFLNAHIYQTPHLKFVVWDPEPSQDNPDDIIWVILSEPPKKTLHNFYRLSNTHK